MNEAPVREVATLVNANGVRVAEFEIDPNSDGAWHHHSQVSEHCYCLKGRIVVEIAGRDAIHLEAGQRCEIPAAVQHRLTNMETQVGLYLVVQGTGAYDFVESKSGA
jgi:mannose-6-phosphate isomerase-like protein (cupin superfamily)